MLGLASRAWAAGQPGRAGRAGAAQAAAPPASSATTPRWSGSSRGCAPPSRPSSRSRPPSRDRGRSRFAYRRPDAARSAQRHVAAVGRWPAGTAAGTSPGFDRDRGAPRVVPAPPDRGRGRSGTGRAGVVRRAGRPRAARDDRPPGRRARRREPSVLRVRAGAGHTLRRRARSRSADVDDDWSTGRRGLRRHRGVSPTRSPASDPTSSSSSRSTLREAVIRRLQGAVDRPPGGRRDDRPCQRTRDRVGDLDRLSRLLTMVPWLLNRQGVALERGRPASSGVTESQLEADLELLFVCGTPGHLPDDLIEAEWEGGRVYLGNADTIARPLRLGVDEALALMVGLRALAAVPGLGERDAVEPRPGQARGRRPATRPPPAPASRSPIEGDAAAESLAAARHGPRRPAAAAPALPRAQPRRDDRARRRPDAGGQHRRAAGTSRAGATAPRTSGCSGSTGSRRSRSWTRTARRRRTPARATWTPASSRPVPTDLLVTLRLEPGAAWVSDYYPIERVEWLEGGSSLVSLRTADTALAAPAAVAPGGAGHRARAGLPRGRGAGRRPAGPGGLRGPRPVLAAGRVGWCTCGGGC